MYISNMVYNIIYNMCVYTYVYIYIYTYRLLAQAAYEFSPKRREVDLLSTC